jgi:integrase
LDDAADNRKNKMALEIKWGRSPFWYGRYIRDGKKNYLNLGVRIDGEPPPSRRLKDKGNAAFERSRLKAELKLQAAIQEMESSTSEEHLLRRIHQLRTGRKIRSIELDSMFERFKQIPREEELSDSTLVQSESRLKKFAAFLRESKPEAKCMADVDSLDAEDFMADIAKQGVSNNTYNKWLIFLRGVFERLRKRAGMSENPFEEIPLKDVGEITGRWAFSPEEIGLILEVSEKPEHEFIRPIIKTAVCTAMRRGDCCKLLWADVDLKAGFIDSVASKNDSKVTIPLAALLRKEIEKRLPARGDHVFPEHLKMYEVNPDGITCRVNRVLADAGFYDPGARTKSVHRGNITKKRKGLRVASIRGCQAFRVTWATTALLSGINEELVRRVTGHRMVSTLRDFYFKPGREDLRREWVEKMPKLFSLSSPSGEPASGAEGLQEKLDAMNAENWEKVREELRKQIGAGKP